MAATHAPERAFTRPAAMPPPDPAEAAVKTWRYLRLAMVLLVVALGASVGHAQLYTSDGCWLGSLSAYYYTPVQGIFVSALVTIGVCLICVKGNTDGEDLLLNLAGICAPAVALIPTRPPRSCGGDGIVPTSQQLNIDNNVTALLVAGGLAFAVLGVLTVGSYLRKRRNPAHPYAAPNRLNVIGFVVLVAVYIALWAFFATDREAFRDNGHGIAAVLMFVFIFANVCLNAVDLHRAQVKQGEFATRGSWSRVRGLLFNRYGVIALLMAGAAAVNGILAWRGFDYWVLTMEVSLITLFATFWGFQTAELWRQGLREEPRDDAAVRPSPATATAGS
jgi:hypothetical protein